MEAARAQLKSVSDDEPDTGRTEVTVNLLPPQPPSPSQPQITVDQQAPGVLRVVFTVVQKFPAWGAVLVALAAIAGYVFLKYTGSIK